MMVTPSRASFSMFSRWIAEKGLSRGTRMSWPRSLITTSAARSSRLSEVPLAMAETVPMEQGQTTICLGAAEPEATGENHSSLPQATI